MAVLASHHADDGPHTAKLSRIDSTVYHTLLYCILYKTWPSLQPNTRTMDPIQPLTKSASSGCPTWDMAVLAF